MVTTVPKYRGNYRLFQSQWILIFQVTLVWQSMQFFCVNYLDIRQCKFVYKVIMAYRLRSCTFWMQFSCVKSYFLWVRFLNKNHIWGIPLKKLLQQGNQYVIYVLLSVLLCCAEPSATLWTTVLLFVRADATYCSHVMGHEKQLIKAVNKEIMKLANSAFTLTFSRFAEDYYHILVS